LFLKNIVNLVNLSISLFWDYWIQNHQLFYGRSSIQVSSLFLLFFQFLISFLFFYFVFSVVETPNSKVGERIIFEEKNILPTPSSSIISGDSHSSINITQGNQNFLFFTVKIFVFLSFFLSLSSLFFSPEWKTKKKDSLRSKNLFLAFSRFYFWKLFKTLYFSNFFFFFFSTNGNDQFFLKKTIKGWLLEINDNTPTSWNSKTC